MQPSINLDVNCESSCDVEIVKLNPLENSNTSPVPINDEIVLDTRKLRRSQSLHDIRTDAAYTEHRVKAHMKYTASESDVRTEFGDSVIDYFTFGKHTICLMAAWTLTSIPLLVKRRLQITTFSQSNPNITIPWIYYLSLSPQNEELSIFMYGTVAINLVLALAFPLFSYLRQSKLAASRTAQLRRDRKLRATVDIEKLEIRTSNILPAKKVHTHRRTVSQPFETIREVKSLPPLPYSRQREIDIVIQHTVDPIRNGPHSRQLSVDSESVNLRRSPIVVVKKTLVNKSYVADKPLVTILGCIGSFICTTGLLGMQAGMYATLWSIDNSQHTWISVVKSCVYAVAFLVWQFSAEIITGWENHRLLHRFRSSYLLKTVLFRISSTIMLFYMTKLSNPDLGGEMCVYISNSTQYLLTLGSELFTTFVSGIILPRLQRRAMLHCCRHSPRGDNSWMPSFELVQETADLEHKKFIVMLSFTSFPLMSCGAMFLYIWKLVVDRFKLFYVCRPEKRTKTKFRSILLIMNTLCVGLTIAFCLISLYWNHSDHTQCILP